MSRTPAQSAGVPLLDLDRDLGSRVCPEDWESARLACRGELVRVPPGAWEPRDGAGQEDEPFAFVIIEGLMCREVALRDRYMFELLGPRDVVQLPVLAEQPRLGGSVRLTAAVHTDVVGLGQSFARVAARWPSLLAAVLRRVEVQRERLAIQGLIAHLPRAEHRVLLVLWHLADRWGRFVAGDTLLPLALTHDLLGHLTASRRSTVTLAVSTLETEGCIRRLDDGAWLLTAAAEPMVEAIAGTCGNARVLGQALMIRHRSSDIRRDSWALREEAKQIRAQERQVGHGLAGG